MKNILLYRYYLEVISVPIFSFLVIHLSGHSLMLFTDEKYEHQSLFGLNLPIEILCGISALCLFIWIWHRPFLQKIVPCSHDHCHHKTVWPHILASAAFVFHFFPESTLRHQMLNNFDLQSLLSIAGAIGFFSHFLVDIIIAILLSSFWSKTWHKISCFCIILGFWLSALWMGKNGGWQLENIAEPIILLFSGFLLTMFIHKPHKPKPACTTCTH